jgi:hypothetical protein
MKRIKTIVFILMLTLSISLLGYSYGRFSVLETITTFNSLDNFYSGGKYGQSPYFEVIDEIKVSVERITKEKYFITYSWITGNQSYFSIVLLIEHLEKLALSKEDFKGIWLEDDLGNKYEPLPYYKLTDFPEDQPLGWKQVFWGKFEPLNKKAKLISIYFSYKDRLYKIKGVNIE